MSSGSSSSSGSGSGGGGGGRWLPVASKTCERRLFARRRLDGHMVPPAI